MLWLDKHASGLVVLLLPSVLSVSSSSGFVTVTRGLGKNVGDFVGRRRRNFFVMGVCFEELRFLFF